MTFKNGMPEKNNFHQYRMIRLRETPKAIEVHFVKNEHDPTELDEPLFPSAFAAVANAWITLQEKVLRSALRYR